MIQLEQSAKTLDCGDSLHQAVEAKALIYQTDKITKAIVPEQPMCNHRR